MALLRLADTCLNTERGTLFLARRPGAAALLVPTVGPPLFADYLADWPINPLLASSLRSYQLTISSAPRDSAALISFILC
jgi:hypothetical protein